MPAATAFHLAPDEAQVWYCWTDECLMDGRAELYRSLLSAEESARLERFRFEHLKREFLVTRALCRLTLSRYAPVHPAAWRFAANRYGRPEVAMPGLDLPLRFNLSNARSLVACVVTRTADAGVDVEEMDRPGETVAIADQYFSKSEVDGLRRLPAAQQRQRFFELWTLKESYIKARGLGLSIPLEQFSFELQETIGISFDARLQDRADDWHFELHWPSRRHVLAVGLRRGCSRTVRVRVRHTVPGGAREVPGKGSWPGVQGAPTHINRATHIR